MSDFVQGVTVAVAAVTAVIAVYGVFKMRLEKTKLRYEHMAAINKRHEEIEVQIHNPELARKFFGIDPLAMAVDKVTPDDLVYLMRFVNLLIIESMFHGRPMERILAGVQERGDDYWGRLLRATHVERTWKYVRRVYSHTHRLALDKHIKGHHEECASDWDELDPDPGTKEARSADRGIRAWIRGAWIRGAGITGRDNRPG